MSPIGKVFTILNLVLAGLFLGWAANAVSQGQDFKQRYEDESNAHKATQAALGGEKSALVARVQELENLNLSLKGSKDEAEARAKRYEEDLAKESARNGQLSASVTKIETTLADINSAKEKMAADMLRAVQAQNEAEKAQAAAEAAQRAAETALADAQQELGTRESSIADLERTRESLKKEASSLQTQLDSLVKATGVSLGMIKAMPEIHGRVLSVVTSPEPGLVAINKGSQDGVQPGFTFEIYDGSTYKGQVRVDYVHDTTSSAVILRTVKGQTIRQGDAASTRL